MIEFFVKKPATTIMLVLVFVVLGAVSYFNLIIETTPKVEFPLVSIDVTYDGASPAEIESQIIKKIEDAVAEISDIKKIQSFAFENFGRIMIEFKVGVDVNVKSIEVKDKVEPIQNDLPEDAEKPNIQKFDPLVEPILDLVLSGKNVDGRTLYEYADKKLRNKLSVIEGVASVDVFGGKQRQLNVTLDPLLMKKRFVDIQSVINAVDQRNVNIPGGAVDKKAVTSSVRMLGEFEDVDELAEMQIVSREGLSLRLKDIATVEDAFRKVENYTRFKGKEAVGLSLKKLSDGDAVSIAKKVRQVLPDIQENLPEGMKLEIAFDSSQFILKDTKITMMNILFGIILTIGILFFFLGDIRVTIVAAVVIPTSLISAAFLMDFSEFSINFMTLLAIATSLGTLIANALVVIESVALHLEHGKNPIEAAIEGTKEAAVPVLASAGTNLVVFTPIAFMGGIVGQFMKQFGLTVVYATIFSLLASFSLTPMLCGLLLRSKKEEKQLEKRSRVEAALGTLRALSRSFLSFLVAEYERIFKRLFKYHWLVPIACILILYLTGYPLKYIGGDFVPASDEDKVKVSIEMPKGTLLAKTLEVTKEVEDLLQPRPEVISYLSYVGTSGTEEATITVNLHPAAEREKSDLDMINELIPEIAKIPDADISFSRGDSGPEEADMTINVHGDDYDETIALSEKMKKIMLESGFFRSVESSHKKPKEEIRFYPDDGRMVRFGVRNNQVGDAIRSAITGNDKNKFKEKGEEYDIQIKYDDRYVQSTKDISEINIMARDGLVPISQLGEVKRATGYASFRRRDKERVVQLNAFMSKSTPGQARKALDEAFGKLDFPEGGRYKYVGNMEFQEETNRELGKSFNLAVVLTLMLLIAILNSFLYPFVIISSIATAFVGVFLLLFFLGHSMNVGSMMAMVMLVGLVVNNAILMLDYALKKMEEGKDVKEALWLGASFKFRTILMTSLAIVFGALPQLTDIFAVKASMGAVIIGGMLASIFFTFILIPVLFYYAVALKKWTGRLFH